MSDIEKCKCSFVARMLGDGCRYCQPQEYIDKLHEIIEDEREVNKKTIEEIKKNLSEI